MKRMFAPYARLEVGLISVGGLAGAALAAWWWPPAAIGPIVLAAALLAFYRDPRRTPPADDSVLIAAADGRIVAAEATKDAAGQPIIRIMTFLSVLDVHVNRAPCGGEVVEVAYKPGRFGNALSDESDLMNESNTLTIRPSGGLPGPVRVRQVAGLLARRIVCVARPGDALRIGDRYGMIKLGSRTEIVAPDDGGWELTVERGSRVRGGETIVARRRAGHR